ncbi:MobC family plasmid mobilization relaxosome protein [Butyrivibrio sp. INlla16]|uniref:MobC family plasmid mobilization relaxosome protein n=1 Tax=Butyrivibrio sp. INlla16 TaxID=1520807 RepID=UPI00147F088B|nr:MobC family plasmid mobilization relaxosome protein [Butyrivibrio sp. INlla16]
MTSENTGSYPFLLVGEKLPKPLIQHAGYGITNSAVQLHRKENNMAKRERTHEVKVRLSDREKTILDKKVALTPSRNREQFLRSLIIHGNVFVVDFSELREISTSLSRIGSNINQIAKVTNTSGSIYLKDIAQLKEEMEKIWQLQRSIASKVRL